MGDFSWIEQVKELSPASLTVRAQTVPPDDRGQLIWDAFMPRQNVDSIMVREMVTPIYRPTSDRREWDQRGRVIPVLTPKLREMKMVPIESTDRISEEEMQEIVRRVGSEEQRIREVLTVSIPQRVDMLAEANYRRVELDFAEAWANQQVIQKDPQTGETQVATYGFDAGRYQTAGISWDNTTAFENFISWLEDGVSTIGGAISGAMMRSATRRMILEAAPTGATGFQLTLSELENLISDRTGQSFRFFVNERTVHSFNDGGTEFTQVKVWPADHIALVPAGEQVGVTAFAPVVRASNLASQAPEARIDVRGQTVFYLVENGGRTLVIEVQLNSMPLPNENLMWVMDHTV